MQMALISYVKRTDYWFDSPDLKQ